MLTWADKVKLQAYKKEFGEMTAEEALATAIHSDTFARQCGPFDIAYERFASDARHFLSYAELLEKEQQQ